MGRRTKPKKEGRKSLRRLRGAGKASRKRVDVDPEAISFQNVELLKRFVTESGRILPRRITGLPAKLHRKLAREIKRARNVLLMK